jgi:hypothetical protein
MSSSAYTPNLGIEQPATGAYANTWGTVANRSYAVLDSAIGGSAQLTLTGAPGTPQQLATTPGGPGAQQGLFPLIIWTGAQTGPGAVTIVPATQQRLFIMRNETAATIAFAQSAGGAQFTLQPGYDANIYCDAADPNANVAAAILNPQYNNVLVTGTLQVNGGLTGNLNLGAMTAASLGLGAPTSVPDALTINGLGSASQAQIRLVEVNYGVLLRNDGSAFSVMATAAGSPYGIWARIPLSIDLASGMVGVGGSAPNASYGLTAPSAHITGSLFVDAGVYCVNVDATNSIVVDGASTNNGTQLDILFGPGSTEGIGSGRTAGSPNQGGLTFFTANAPRIYITNGGLVGIGVAPDQLLTVGGYVHTTAGIVFPDGSVQTTAVTGGGTGSFTQLTVTGNAAIGGALGVTGLVTVSNNINLTSGHTFQINGVPLVSGITGVTTYVGGLAEWTEPGIGLAAGVGISLTASHSIPGVYGTVTINNTNPSDARLKRNVRPLEGGLSIIERLRIIEAEYNGLGGTRDGERTVGVIAQELARVLPDSVIVSGEADFLHVDTREIFFQLVLAVQQLSGLAKGILQAAAL